MLRKFASYLRKETIPQASIGQKHAKLGLPASSGSEAIAAVDRAVILRLERNFRLLATGSACHLEHRALTAVAIVAAASLATAVATANRIILKPLLLVEFLLTCRERELLATILANQCPVLKLHEISPLLVTCETVPMDALAPTA